MAKWFSVACVLALALTGCAKERLIGGPDLQVIPGDQLPAPAKSDLLLEQRSYLIGPYDKVAIDVYGMDTVSRTVQVDANGQIAIPIAGNLDAAGKTPSELGDLIRARLQERYVRDPQVTVNIDTINQVITVDGAVGTPGLYPLSGRMTLMRAVAAARGTTEFADQSFVVVYRRVNNQQLAALYDMRAIREGLYADPEVYANDVVQVGESRARRVFKDVVQSSGLITAPLIAVIR